MTMLFMTSSFFLVEIIVGYVTNSVALVADSFHMLSDVVALIIGFASIRVSTSQIGITIARVGAGYRYLVRELSYYILPKNDSNYLFRYLLRA